MNRVIITGRNDTVPKQAFTSSGMTPDAGAAADLRRSIPKGGTRTILRSVHPSALQRPSASPKAEGHSLADKVVDVLTVIAGLAVFGMLALFALVMA